MGIQLNGNNDNISAVDGDLSITGIVTFSQLDVGNNIKLGNAGVITATSFSGDGSNLTGVSGVTINNNAANKVIMGSNTANTLEAVAKSTLFGNLSHGQNFLDDQSLVFGDASDMILIHQSSGAKSRLRNTNDSGSLDIESTLTRFTNKDGSTEKLRIDSSGKIITPLGTSTRIGIADRTSGTGAGGSLLVTAGSARGSGQTTGNLLLAAGRGNNAASNGVIRFGHNDGSDGTGLDQEWLRIASNGQVSISSDGTTDGLLTIKGDSDQVGTPSIRLLDGSDTREVSITNTSGDFVASVHGNDNAIHGHIKMFESGQIDFNNGGASGSNTNRLRIDTSGNLTIPTTDAKIQLKDGNNYIQFVDADKNFKFMNAWGAGEFTFHVSGGERLRIDSSGNMYMGTVDGSMWNNTDAGHGWSWMQQYGTVATKTDRASGYSNMYINKTNTGSGSDERWISFGWDAGDYGNIRRSGSGVNYQSNSDYRLKENVVSLNDGISRLKNLKPSRFNWKVEPGVTLDGFIAHEAQTVVPESVSGEKDQVADDSNVDTENGTPIYQKMDNSKLIPLITAALQEAIAKIETLEQDNELLRKKVLENVVRIVNLENDSHEH